MKMTYSLLVINGQFFYVEVIYFQVKILTRGLCDIGSKRTIILFGKRLNVICKLSKQLHPWVITLLRTDNL